MDCLEFCFGLHSGPVWVVFGSLFGFGFFYNWFVSWFNRQGYSDGYTAILVVFGVAVTLCGSAFLIGFENSLLVLGAFGCSGFFMVVGDAWRHVQARKREAEDEQRRTLAQ